VMKCLPPLSIVLLGLGAGLSCWSRASIIGPGFDQSTSRITGARTKQIALHIETTAQTLRSDRQCYASL